MWMSRSDMNRANNFWGMARVALSLGSLTAALYAKTSPFR